MAAAYLSNNDTFTTTGSNLSHQSAEVRVSVRQKEATLLQLEETKAGNPPEHLAPSAGGGALLQPVREQKVAASAKIGF